VEYAAGGNDLEVEHLAEVGRARKGEEQVHGAAQRSNGSDQIDNILVKS
jgi:hypothetical protein